MKTIFKKIGLSFAALACAICAGAGIATSIPQQAKTAKAENAVALANDEFYISGAGARLINDANGAGIRFHTNLLESEYANVQESGTLIIPDFRYDGELTLEDLEKDAKNRPTHIVTKGTVDGKAVDFWREAPTDGYKRATVYLYNIPEKGYGTRMVVSSYVKINGEYHYTTLEEKNYVSLSDVATRVINGGAEASVAERLTPFVVDTVKVTYVLTDGSKQTEEVAYGGTLTPPTLNYSEAWATFQGWQDQYGNTWDLAKDTASYPVTLTPIFTTPMAAKQVASVVIKDGYDATHASRAWVNGSTPEILTEGKPAGFNVLNKFTWYKESASLWMADGRAFYRNCYSQVDISGYEQVRFMLKVETQGDAHIKLANGTKVSNEWLKFELLQTAANVWTLNVYNESDELVYNKEGVTRSILNNDLTDVDSVASLIFCAVTNNANLMAATSTDYDVYVYTTEVLGYVEKDVSVFPTGKTSVVWEHIWNSYYFTGGGQPEGAYSDEAAPAGFTKVSEYSWVSTSSNDFPVTGHLSNANVSQYSDLYFAMKVENGMDIYVQGASVYTGGDWLYVHMYQAEDGTWSKDFSTLDGSYIVVGKQTGLTDTTLTALMQWQSGVNRGSYPRRDKTQDASIPATAYFTEVRGILKDGDVEDTDKTIEIPEEAIAVRAYPWRDDRYTDTNNGGKIEILTDGAPEGYSLVLKHTWATNRTAEYTYCFDATTDITQYSDLYFATKIENGTRIYIANSGGHYEGKDGWLYAHYNQVSAGVWQPTFASEDGYYVAPSATISATTIKALVDGKLYGFAETAGNGTITYWTEILAKSETQGERVIWSAVDGAKLTDDAVGAPAGFTSTYKKEGFTPSNFASFDLTNTIYQEIRFGMIANADLTFKAGYKYKFAEEDTERPTTSIMYNTGSYPQMYTVNLTNNGGNSWTVTMNVKRWVSAPASGGSSAQIPDTEPFTATVTGSSLSEIMSTILNNSNVTIYVTEVRGTHECSFNEWVSNGDGTLTQVCACGEKGETKDFEHGIPEDAAKVRDSIWRDNNYALSASTTEAVPVGFTNVKEYNWNHNTVIVNGVPYGSTSKDMPLTCLDEADVSAYNEVWFAMKNVGGTGFYVRGASKYEGNDWLYYHLVKVDGAWTLSLSSPDGYVANNVQTGIVGNTLKDILSYNGSSAEKPWNSGAYPTKTDGDTTSDVRVYFTDMRACSGCDGTHSVTRIVSNEDGTHNEVCASCGEVVAENVACSGGEATCTAGAICSACGYEYEAATGHNAAWTLGKYVCSTCGEVVDTAETVAASAIVAATNLTLSNNEAGITAPEGFNSVTNFFSASGNTWSSKILSSGDFAGADLTAFSEVWFAIAIEGGHFTNTADNWKNLDADNQLVWVSFHLTQTATETWTVEIKVDGVLYNTFADKPGKTIYNIIENNYSGLRLVIYQQTANNLSNADVNIYATEVLGVFQTGISENAEKVWDHIWNTYYFTGGGQPEGAYSEEAAPEGFSKVSEYTWTGKDFAGKYGHFNASDISGYSDIWFAMKATAPGNIYLQGAPSNGAITGEWVYVHYHQVSDGVWTKDYRTASGFYSPSTNHVNITGTKLTDIIGWKSGVNQGSYPNAEAGVTATAYFTEVIGVKKCDGVNHTADSIVSNGDGTHSVTCRCGVVVNASEACSGGKATCTQLAKCSICGGEYGDYAAHVAVSYVSNGDGTHNAICACGEVVNANVDCAGVEASCTEAAVCSTCEASYGEALGHSGDWVGEEYLCSRCGVSCGDVDTTLDKQNVALFTNATAITANEETAATIDLSSATDLNITEVKSFTLDSMNYTATVSGNKVSFNVMPNSVFGEYVATATVLVEGKEFEITVPVTIVTNMITTPAGMLNMKYVLRGKTDVAKVADTSAQNEQYLVYQGGTGGAATMNGDGYYMLGADINLIQDGGGNTDVYVWGTSAVPFVGTFDGNGHILKGFKKTNWFSGHTLEDTSVTGSYANELEGSLFGYVNGKVKNVAFTGVELGIYANIVLDGTGVLEDVYLEIADLQDNANVYVAPIFWRNAENAYGTLRNVVINLTNQAMGATPSTQYPSLMKYITAENVSVYGFDTSWINGDRGNVYWDTANNDGSEAGIYVEYADSSTNGADFFTWNLDNNLWKIVDGYAYLKNVTVSGTAVTPESTAPEAIVATDDNVVANGATEYRIVWSNGEAGSYSAVRLIRDIMKKATGITLPAGLYNEDESTKQIVVGSFAQYQDKVDSLNEVALSDDSYGVYVENRTIYVLAENEEAFVLAAEKLCRELFDLFESVGNVFTYGDFTNATRAIPSINYTTEIAFNMRGAAFTNVAEEKYSMNMTARSSFTYFEEMHNTFNYFTDYTGSGTWKSLDETQLCYLGRGDATTFNSMVNHVVNKIVAKAQEDPNMTVINFMIEDNAGYCTCTACRKFTNDSNTTTISQLDYNTSVTQLIFLNAVANKLATNATLVAAGRTIAVEFFAYGLFSDAPLVGDESALTSINNSFGLNNETTTVTYANGKTATVLKAADNLRVWWTSHKANHSFRLTHDANEHMLQSLQGWIASIGAENVDVFMYQAVYRDFFMPLNTWQYQIEWYQDLNDLGVNSYMFNLGNTFNKAEAQTTFSAFKTYIDSRAMMDRNVTFTELKDEFFGVNGYYGAAGSTMRTYFEQLVSVMEGLKQDGSNGYINPIQLLDSSTSDAVRRQAFFNGHYGYDFVSVAFGGKKSSNSGITGADIFTYDGQTQQATLESWYTMCQEALALVVDNPVYAKRVQVEALFPEYAFLVLESTYTTNAMWISNSYSGSVTAEKGTSEVITKTYQEFYDNVIALGVTKPAEFFDFNTGDTMTLDTMSTIASGTIFTYGMYQSMYMNWGISF